jgi:hypothetical protein
MLRAQRHAHGSVRFDKRRKTWNYLWYEAGKRRSKLIGTKHQYATKAAAWTAVERIKVKPKATGETVEDVVARYQTERMPSRHSTARVYRSFLNNHILPKWGDTLIQDVQPRPVDCGCANCPYRPNPRRTCAVSCTLLWTSPCGRGFWTWGAIPSHLL